jgi:hypothetical protein
MIASARSAANDPLSLTTGRFRRPANCDEMTIHCTAHILEYGTKRPSVGSAPRDEGYALGPEPSVACDADGLTGHAGAVLLRKLPDQCGLTSALGAALARAGKFPLFDRGVALVSMAVAIVPGATSMNDIALLAHQELVFGPPISDTTVRRTLELAGEATLRKVAKARAKIRAHVRELIAATPAGSRGWPSPGRP